jgi:hypothetical protein
MPPRLGDWPINRIAELTPDAWKAGPDKHPDILVFDALAESQKAITILSCTRTLCILNS